MSVKEKRIIGKFHLDFLIDNKVAVELKKDSFQNRTLTRFWVLKNIEN